MGFDEIDLGNLFQIGYFYQVQEDLVARGYRVCVTEVSPANTVAYRATQLSAQVDSILSYYSATKVNIIGHSMGGLDARYLVSSLGYASKVASVSTVATPHRGSEFADVGLGVISLFGTAAEDALNEFLVLFGAGYNDSGSVSQDDARAAIQNLTTSFATTFNTNNPNQSGVYYQSWAGRTGTAAEVFLGTENDRCGALCFSYGVMVLAGAGPNDGAVSVTSAQWGVYQGVIDADHFEEIGHTSALSQSTTFTDHKAFYANIAQGLVGIGF